MIRQFHKMHGLGNDFAIFDAREMAFDLDAAAVRALADRRTGIGCDQLILLLPSSRADLAMRIFNADGGEVGACGNATRCVAALVGGRLTIETGGGLLQAEAEVPGGTGPSIDMGPPRFAWDEIPLAYPMDTSAMPVGWEMLDDAAAVNVGNPHIIFFVADVDAVPLERLGPLIERDPLFPDRVNVNVAACANGGIRLRVWERGAGLTRACGTGACATAVAAVRRGLAASPVTVALPGGTLEISWTPGESIRMTGPARHVFTGEIDLAAHG